MKDYVYSIFKDMRPEDVALLKPMVDDLAPTIPDTLSLPQQLLMSWWITAALARNQFTEDAKVQQDIMDHLSLAVEKQSRLVASLEFLACTSLEEMEKAEATGATSMPMDFLCNIIKGMVSAARGKENPNIQ